MNTIMLELRNATDCRTGKLCGAWIEMRQRRTEPLPNGSVFFPGRLLEPPEHSGLAKQAPRTVATEGPAKSN